MKPAALIIGLSLAAGLFCAVFADGQVPPVLVAVKRYQSAHVVKQASLMLPAATVNPAPQFIWIGIVLDGTNEIQQCLDMTNQIWSDTFVTSNPTVWFQVSATNSAAFFRNKITWQAGNKIGCLISTNAPF